MIDRTDARCAAILKRVRREGCNAILVTKPENVHYLSGFGGEDSWVIIARDRRILVTDGRFVEEASISAPNFEACIRKGGIAAETAGILAKLGGTVAFEASHLTVAAHEALVPKRRRRYRLVATSGAVEDLRMVKDAGEVATIRRAIAAAEAGLKTALGETSREMTEAEFAAALEFAMRREGAEGAAFPTIAAGEPLSSLPHAKPSGGMIYTSSTLLVDWGARVSNYNSDLTRVVAWGKVTPRIARIWKVVKAAQREALRTIKAGVSAARVDAAARRVIADAGYGEFFGHGLGHGVGLEVHEGPVLSPRSKARLKAGMIVTVEPGIYLPGVGGVRLEDIVLVTAKGAELLTTVSRDAHSLAGFAPSGA